MSRQIFAYSVLAAFCGTVSGQVDSPIDAFNRLKAQAEESTPADSQQGDFDILDLPADLFNRRPERPRVKLPPLELDKHWDYRFDAQFQSTVNPYMRWYMRQNPATPQKRFLTDEYKAGQHGFHASAEGYSAYSPAKDAYGQPISPYYQGQFGSVRYWDHLNWLYHQYSTTPIDRSFKTTGRPLRDVLERPEAGDGEEAEEAIPSLPDLFSETKPATMNSLRRQSIWVCRHQKTSQISILYVKPSQQVQARFHEAQAAMTGTSILALKWKSQPSWADEVVLDAGRLKNTEASSSDRDQIASSK